jgi:hypothetical protein
VDGLSGCIRGGTTKEINLTHEQEIADLKIALREALSLNSLIVADLEYLIDEFDNLTRPAPNSGMPSKHYLPTAADQRKQRLNAALQKFRDTVR